jgi:hypothetical protein
LRIVYELSVKVLGKRRFPMKRLVDRSIVLPRVLVLVVLCFASQSRISPNTQPPVVEWQAVLGGPGSQLGDSVIQTADGSFVVVGSTRNPVDLRRSLSLLKIREDTEMIWERSFGGPCAYGETVEQTSDGGYIAVGEDGIAFHNGQLYLVKTDELGILSWDRHYGGQFVSVGCCVDETADGGYLAGGWICSSSTSCQQGYLVRTDGRGEPLWEGEFGGPLGGQATSLLETRDGSYVVAGNSLTTPTGGWLLIYLGRWTSSGEAVWERHFDGLGIPRDPTNDRGPFLGGARDPRVVELPDGAGYVLAGILVAPEPETVGLFWFDGGGHLLSRRTLRAPGEFLDSFQLTLDAGFLLAGVSRTPLTRRGEIHLVKAGALGGREWELRFAGTDSETGAFARPTADGGYVVVATDGPRNETPEDRYEIRLVKLSAENQVEKLFVRGDSNTDVSLDVSDAVTTLSWLFLGGSLGCDDAADANDDGSLDIADPIYTLGFLFTGGPEIPAPYPERGGDPTPDALGCER